MQRLIYFNTSHVSINRCTAHQRHSFVHISIHLMFLLICNRHGIPCSCHNFNTSHVSINHGDFKTLSVLDGDFNTSHVSINQTGYSWQRIAKTYFNTSHVSINPKTRYSLTTNWQISIHLMFLLIHIRMEQGQPERYFNTSHVSINLSLYPIHVYVHHDFNTSHVSINLKPCP